MSESPLHDRTQWLESRVEELREFEQAFYKISAGLVEVEAMLEDMPWFAKLPTRDVLAKVRELQDG